MVLGSILATRFPLFFNQLLANRLYFHLFLLVLHCCLKFFLYFLRRRLNFDYYFCFDSCPLAQFLLLFFQKSYHHYFVDIDRPVVQYFFKVFSSFSFFSFSSSSFTFSSKILPIPIHSIESRDIAILKLEM